MKPVPMRWFARQRQIFIKVLLSTVGSIQRGDICQEFGVTLQVASSDLQTFIKLNAGGMAYNKTAKRYERAGGIHQPICEHGVRDRLACHVCTPRDSGAAYISWL